MADVHGADLDGMTRLSEIFDTTAERVDAVRTESLSQLGLLNALWHGPDSHEFTNQWTSVHSPALRRVVDDLRDVAERIKENRDDQERTSAVGDGGGGGGGLFSGLGRAWDGATGFVSDTWDDVTEFTSDAWDFTSEVASDGWDHVSAFGSEAGHRFTELGEYLWANGKRRLTNPVQSIIDDMTLTGPFELLVGTGAILGLGGEFESGFGNGQFEGIHGTSIAPDGAITLGHTVIFDSATPSANLIEHEQQHVYDIESVGGLPFYLTYLGHWGINIASGQDASLGGEAYENIWWEQRGDHVQHGPDVPSHLTFDFDPWSWFD